MDLLTVTCSRDKNEMALQAHSIDMWVQNPCRHVVIIEDDLMPLSEWESLLNRFYKRHELCLIKNTFTSGHNSWINQMLLRCCLDF